MSAAITCGFMGDAPSVDSRDAVCCDNSTSFLSAASSCWLQPSRKGNSRGNRSRPNGCDANLPVRGSPHEKGGGGETPDSCGRYHPIVKPTVSHREGRIPTLDEVGSRRKVLVVFQASGRPGPSARWLTNQDFAAPSHDWLVPPLRPPHYSPAIR
jgi:hypothetical protein